VRDPEQLLRHARQIDYQASIASDAAHRVLAGMEDAGAIPFSSLTGRVELQNRLRRNDDPLFNRPHFLHRPPTHSINVIITARPGPISISSSSHGYPTPTSRSSHGSHPVSYTRQGTHYRQKRTFRRPFKTLIRPSP
jgi:hypothetical protein